MLTFVFDVDNGGWWYEDSFSCHLNPKALALLDAVSEAAQLGNELRLRVILFDVALRSLLSQCHLVTSVAARVCKSTRLRGTGRRSQKVGKAPAHCCRTSPAIWLMSMERALCWISPE